MYKTKSLYLLGNEAIAYAAVEAGLDFASSYPGTPSTEIMETLAKLSKKYGFYVEWSVNEKVAFEAAYGASIAGAKSLVSMKHVGLNVAADPLTTSAYTGVNNSFVIVSADDPGMWSSQNEQDNRFYGLRSYIPVLEPTDLFSIRETVLEAFKLSSIYKHPVILRITTRIGHSRVQYFFSEPRREVRPPSFKKDPKRFSVIPAHARELREDMLERWERIRRYVNRSPLNKVVGSGKHLIITSGFAYSYVSDVLNRNGLKNIKVLALGAMIPIPDEFILNNLGEAESILVVEELEPILETYIKSLLYSHGYSIPVYGKDYIPVTGELNITNVERGIFNWLGRSIEKPRIYRNKIDLPGRPPTFCPGCPHRGTFFSLRKAVNRSGLSPVYSGDIGCYSLAVLPPFNMQDTIVEMGGSIGLANGFSQVLKDGYIIVATIGDSTFFHSGIPALINAVYNRAPMLIVILDNRVTAMTGGQPHPGSGYDALGREAPNIDIEGICRAIGIEYIKVVDPFKIKDSESVFREAIEYIKENSRPAVVIARRACTLHIISMARRRGIEIPLYTVEKDKCIKCGICYNNFSCPAIYPDRDGYAEIDPALCVGCGECVEVCPTKAFKEVRGWTKEFESLWW